jgi:hypothetical protein
LHFFGSKEKFPAGVPQIMLGKEIQRFFGLRETFLESPENIDKLQLVG